MEDDSFCIGCLAYDNLTLNRICIRIIYNKTGNCPCVTCIIKMMCGNSCNARNHWGGTLE